MSLGFKLKAKANGLLRGIPSPAVFHYCPRLITQRCFHMGQFHFGQLPDAPRQTSPLDKWAKTIEKTTVKISEEDSKRIQHACGVATKYVMLSKFPFTATPRDVFQFNRTNDNFKEIIEDFFFERSQTFDFNGYVFLQFPNEEPAIRFCFDVLSSGAFTGGEMITARFVDKNKFSKSRVYSLTREQGAGTTICITGLPALTIAPDIVKWIEPHQIPLAFENSMSLAIKPLNPTRFSSGRVLKQGAPSSASMPDSRNKKYGTNFVSSSGFLVRLTSEADAYLLVSRLHMTPFRATIYKDRFHPSVTMVY